MRSEADTPVEQRYLWLEGKVSPASLDLIKSGLPTERPAHVEALFVGFAYADLPLPKRFDFVFLRGRPQEGVPCECRVTAATQQFGIELPEVPHGWKTICIVHFPTGVPELVRQLPTVDDWYENEPWVCICDDATREHLQSMGCQNP